ncbi:MAG: hypothetical protein H8E14_13930 [Candidatus Marinimicrobia bacterium]|nr:hypothetical protein [Candidatus Neomarinimicrobiota bacterium]
MKKMNQILIIFGLLGMLAGQEAALAPEAVLTPGGNRMEMMVVWRLTEHLKLTPEQAEVFFPAMREHREKIKKLNTERVAAGRTMVERAERGETITDKDYKAFLKLISDLEKQKIDLRSDYLNRLDGVLTNTQRVKLMIFDERFKNELQRNIRERREAINKRDRMMGQNRRPNKRY